MTAPRKPKRPQMTDAEMDSLWAAEHTKLADLARSRGFANIAARHEAWAADARASRERFARIREGDPDHA